MAKKKTILDLYQMKEKGEQAVWIVLYDACYASYAEEAGMDMIIANGQQPEALYALLEGKSIGTRFVGRSK